MKDTILKVQQTLLTVKVEISEAPKIIGCINELAKLLEENNAESKREK